MPKPKLHRTLAAAVVAILALPCASAQSAVQLANAVNTLAGTGTAALYGDNGPAAAADLNQPHGVVADAARNLYIADTGNSVVRRIDSITGTITTIAGTGTAGFSGDAGAATSAQLNAPVGVALDANGDLYIADTGNNRIRVLYEGGTLASQLITLENPSVSSPVIGDIYTVAGSSTTAGYSGDLGKASLATFATPQRLAVDASGNVYISDSANHRVRMIYLSGTAAAALVKSANAAVNTPTPGYLYTVVGNGTASSTGDGAAAGLATINAPSGIAVDALGNLFLAESAGNRVRVVFVSGTLLTSLIKLDATGSPTPVVNAIYTLIGTGAASYSGDGALGSTATINQPGGLFVDSAEDIYLADSGNHIVRLLTASSGLLSTFAGNSTLGAGFSGDQGLATAAAFASPSDVTQDAMGRILIADGIGNQRIRAVFSNTVLPATAIGSTSASQTVLLQVNSALQFAGLAVVPSMGGSTEYAVTPSSNCAVGTQLSAGTLCTLTVSFTPAYPGQRNVPLAVTDSNGNVYSFTLSGTGNGAQTAVIPGQMTTIAGTGVPGFSGDNGPATAAKIDVPGNIAVDAAGNIFFSDKSNSCIRVIYEGGPVVAHLIYLETGYTATVGSIYTIASKLSLPTNMAIDANDNVYYMEISKTVRKLSAQTGLISTVVGNGSAGYAGDGGLAVNAELFLANGIALDNLGNLYVVDGNNYRIRKVVLSTGVINTIAGTGINGFSGDFGPASAAQISLAQAVAADQYGNVYIADDGYNARIRVIYGGGSPSLNPAAKLIMLMNPFITTPVQGYIYTVAGTGTTGYTGDGGAANIANLDFPYSLSLDAAGNIYFPEEGSNHLRRIDVGDGIIRTIGGYAATASPFGSAAGDGGVATSAYLNKPYGATVDPLGNVYIADGSNDRIRFISSSAYPLTFASTTVGSTSASQTVTAVSNGNLPYDFSAFVLNGQSGQFAQVSSGTAFIPQCGLATPLPAGDSCTTALTFSPHSDGTVTGSEVFAGNAPTQTVQLTSTGTGGTASTTVLTLPSTAVYGSTVAVSAAVTAGGSPVTSGTVVFSNGTQTIATVSLGAAGTAATTLPIYAVGSYSITATYSAAGTANLLSSATSNISITPATLTVTASNQSLVYGQPVPALTYTITGFVNNDTQSVVTGAPALSTTATSTSADGVYPITCATGTLSAANYTFTCVNGSLTVSGATAQTITFNVVPNQVYGAASFTLSPTSSSGLPVALTVSGPATLNGYTVTVTGVGTVTLQASQPGNSVYRAAVPVSQSFTVLPAPLTIVVANASRTYGAPNPAFTGTVTGLVRGDTLGTTVLVTYGASAGLSATAGSYAITATVSGPDGADYAPTVTQGTLTVQQAPLTVTVTSAGRAYGAANPAFSATVSGLVNGDAIGVTLLESFSTTATITSAVGSYPINVAVTGSSAAQYAIQTVPGVLTVTPVALAIGANSVTRLYGTANPAFTGTITGALNGDTFTESFTTTATTTTNAGNYAIVPSVAGPNLADYAVAATNGTLQIERANSLLALVASATTVNVGTAVSFTATATSSTTGAPTGSVSFLDGSTLLATVALSNGVAVFTTSSLLVGTHTISASYTGDYDFYGSSAAAVSSVVAAPGYTVTPAATALTIASGTSGTVGIQVASVGGYAGTVSFACAGLPGGMSCSFAPASIGLTTASATQQTVLTIGTSSSQASLRGGDGPGPLRSMVYLAVMPGLLSLCFMRRHLRQAGRWTAMSLSALVMLGAVASLSGCGSTHPSTRTQKGTYIITVQAQATNASSNSFQLAVMVD